MQISTISNLESSENFLHYNFETYRNLLIFQLGQFQKFPIKKISRISNSEISENFQFIKFQKCPICKFSKILNSENSKNFEFEKFRKFPKIYTFAKHRIFVIIQFRKIASFQNFTMWITIKIP